MFNHVKIILEKSKVILLTLITRFTKSWERAERIHQMVEERKAEEMLKACKSGVYLRQF